MRREPGERAHDSLTGNPATKHNPRIMNLDVISLGCDKATVDSERLVGDLIGHGAKVVPDLETADVILVNTCGFIDVAKRESIDAFAREGGWARPGDFIRVSIEQAIDYDFRAVAVA